jgi:hypothetical protein
MTLTEKWKMEGLQEGLEKGLIKAKKMLSRVPFLSSLGYYQKSLKRR